MAHLIPYLALASFPVASLLALNPMRFFWGLRHGFEPMPVGMRDKAESVDRYFYFVVYAVAAGFVVGLMSRSGVRAAAVGLRMNHWGSNVAVGIAAGTLLILIQILLARRFPNLGPLPTTDRFQRRSVGLWVMVFLSASLAEEFWIAFCLVSMTATGHSEFISVTATAAVFGVQHLAYRLPAMLTVAARGIFTALLFLWLGSLIPMVLFHFIGNLGNLYWLRRTARGDLTAAGGSR